MSNRGLQISSLILGLSGLCCLFTAFPHPSARADGSAACGIPGQIDAVEKQLTDQLEFFGTAAEGTKPVGMRVAQKRMAPVYRYHDTQEAVVVVNAKGEIVGAGKVDTYKGMTVYLDESTYFPVDTHEVFSQASYLQSAAKTKRPVKIKVAGTDSPVDAQVLKVDAKKGRVTVRVGKKKQRYALNEVELAPEVAPKKIASGTNTSALPDAAAGIRKGAQTYADKQKAIRGYVENRTRVVILDENGEIVTSGVIREYEGEVIYFRKRDKTKVMDRDEAMKEFEGYSVLNDRRVHRIVAEDDPALGQWVRVAEGSQPDRTGLAARRATTVPPVDKVVPKKRMTTIPPNMVKGAKAPLTRDKVDEIIELTDKDIEALKVVDDGPVRARGTGTGDTLRARRSRLHEDSRRYFEEGTPVTILAKDGKTVLGQGVIKEKIGQYVYFKKPVNTGGMGRIETLERFDGVDLFSTEIGQIKPFGKAKSRKQPPPIPKKDSAPIPVNDDDIIEVVSAGPAKNVAKRSGDVTRVERPVHRAKTVPYDEADEIKTVVSKPPHPRLVRRTKKDVAAPAAEVDAGVKRTPVDWNKKAKDARARFVAKEGSARQYFEDSTEVVLLRPDGTELKRGVIKEKIGGFIYFKKPVKTGEMGRLETLEKFDGYSLFNDDIGEIIPLARYDKRHLPPPVPKDAAKTPVKAKAKPKVAARPRFADEPTVVVRQPSNRAPTVDYSDVDTVVKAHPNNPNVIARAKRSPPPVPKASPPPIPKDAKPRSSKQFSRGVQAKLNKNSRKKATPPPIPADALKKRAVAAGKLREKEIVVKSVEGPVLVTSKEFDQYFRFHVPSASNTDVPNVIQKLSGNYSSEDMVITYYRKLPNGKEEKVLVGGKAQVITYNDEQLVLVKTGDGPPQRISIAKERPQVFRRTDFVEHQAHMAQLDKQRQLVLITNKDGQRAIDYVWKVDGEHVYLVRSGERVPIKDIESIAIDTRPAHSIHISDYYADLAKNKDWDIVDDLVFSSELEQQADDVIREITPTKDAAAGPSRPKTNREPARAKAKLPPPFRNGNQRAPSHFAKTIQTKLNPGGTKSAAPALQPIPANQRGFYIVPASEKKLLVNSVEGPVVFSGKEYRKHFRYHLPDRSHTKVKNVLSDLGSSYSKEDMTVVYFRKLPFGGEERVIVSGKVQVSNKGGSKILLVKSRGSKPRRIKIADAQPKVFRQSDFAAHQARMSQIDKQRQLVLIKLKDGNRAVDYVWKVDDEFVYLIRSGERVPLNQIDNIVVDTRPEHSIQISDYYDDLARNENWDVVDDMIFSDELNQQTDDIIRDIGQ